MSHIPRMTLIGMYDFEATLFDDMTVPTGIDKQKFINSLLMAYGEKPVLYTSVPFMKFSIKVWSEKWYDSFANINAALTASYNKIHNFDRHEEYTDTEDGTDNRSSSTSNTITGSSSTEKKDSAYNESVYQPNEKVEGSDTTTSGGSGSNNAATHRVLDHEAHLYGNIGVTTSQQMITEEIKLRKESNVFEIMAEVFSRELLLYSF